MLVEAVAIVDLHHSLLVDQAVAVLVVFVHLLRELQEQ
jgi:hypothetical protein